MSDGPNVYRDDKGVIIVRASAFGHCELQLWAAFDGVQPMDHKDVTKRAFAEGHLHEEAVVQQRTQEGYNLYGDQTEVVLKIIPGKLHIVGHIDGVIEYGESNVFDRVEFGGPRLHEIKSMSRAAFDDWIAGRFDYRPGYAWQLSIYMLAMKLKTAMYDVKRRDDGLIDTWLMDTPPYSRKEVKARAEMLLDLFSRDEMPPCTGEGGAKWFCEYWFLHDEDEVKVSDPEVPIDNIPELDDLMGAYYEAVETEKWVKKERARLKAKINDEFRNKRKVVRTEGHVLKVSESSSSRFDKAGLSAEIGQELINKYTKKTPTEVWTIDKREG